MSVAPASGRELDILRLAVEGTPYIGIRGEASGFPLFPARGVYLRDRGGVTIRTSDPPSSAVEVVYDVLMADGRGYHVFDALGNEIEQFRDLILWHELAHAHMQAFNAIPAMGEAETAITMENAVRRDRSLPDRNGHDGGIGKPAPPKPPSSMGSTSRTGSRWGCFVATAAFGSSLDPEVAKLRVFRDDVLRSTRLGREWWERFFTHYEKFSPALVELIERDAEVRRLVRDALVTPLIHYLELLTTFPDDRIEEAGLAWGDWLTLARDRFESFACGALDLPTDFAGLDAAAAVTELEIILRLALRTPERRLAWLTELAGRGALPLDPGTAERKELRRRLAEGGRTEAEIDLIFGARYAVTRATEISPRDCSCRAAQPVVSSSMYGDDTLKATGGATGIDPTQWYYTVTIRNATTDTFDVIQAFYKATSVTDGVVSANEYIVPPGTTIVLNMGVCEELVSYTVAFVLNDEVVWTIPDPTFAPNGTLVTPKVPVTWQDGLARDGQRCEDSYVIGDGP